MPYLSWNDIERIAENVVRDYKHYFVPEKRLCYNVEPDLLAQMLGLKIEYGFLSDDGSVYGLTSPDEVCITTFDDHMNEEIRSMSFKDKYGIVHHPTRPLASTNHFPSSSS